MTKQDKIKKKQAKAKIRYQKNINRNIQKLRHKKKFGHGLDCPFDVEMYDKFGTCTCGHSHYNDCCGDI